MKAVIIALVVMVFLVCGFVLYCCVRVGKKAEEQYSRRRGGQVPKNEEINHNTGGKAVRNSNDEGT